MRTKTVNVVKTTIADQGPCRSLRQRSGWAKTSRVALAALQPYQQSAATSVVPCNVAMVDGDAIGARRVDAVVDLPLDPVDDGEIIKFAVKPSMWSPLLESSGWLGACVVLALLCITARVGVTNLSPQTTAQMILGVGALRLGLAIVRWVSCWYVLTNRRVVEIRGIRSPTVTSAMLLDVRNTYLSSAVYEKPLHLGTITFVSNRDSDRPWQWKHLAEPEQIHARVRRAIENAIDSLSR